MILAVALLLLATGCGSNRPAVAPVRGSITIDGRPVTVGRIMFYPKEGRAATAPINPDGTYVLTTFDAEDGALPGMHKVTVISTELVAPPPPRPDEEYKVDGKMPIVKWLVPQRYSDPTTSDLKAEVKSQANTIDFGLKAR
jgi:hypothetical protein